MFAHYVLFPLNNHPMKSLKLMNEDMNKNRIKMEID